MGDLHDDDERKHRQQQSLERNDECEKSEGHDSSSLRAEADLATSVESLLAVPLDVIFHEEANDNCSRRKRRRADEAEKARTDEDHPPRADQGRKRKLLSRSEASVFLRTNLLAHEVDILMGVASDALHRSLQCRMLGRQIAGGMQQRWLSPTIYQLRALLPLLALHGGQVPSQALEYVRTELDRVLAELRSCASTLRQLAEQNWNVAAHLLEPFGGIDSYVDLTNIDDDTGNRSSKKRGRVTTGSSLGWEKTVVAEIEDAVCSRIEALLSMTLPFPTASSSASDGGGGDLSQPSDAFDVATDETTGQYTPMKDLCATLLKFSDPQKPENASELEDEMREERKDGGAICSPPQHEKSELQTQAACHPIAESNTPSPQSPENDRRGKQRRTGDKKNRDHNSASENLERKAREKPRSSTARAVALVEQIDVDDVGHKKPDETRSSQESHLIDHTASDSVDNAATALAILAASSS